VFAKIAFSLPSNSPYKIGPYAGQFLFIIGEIQLGQIIGPLGQPYILIALIQEIFRRL